MDSIIASFDTLRSLAFGSIGASYLPLGTPFTHPVRVLKILNTTNADMLISTDAVSDYDYIPAGSFVLYDISANEANGSNGWFFPIGLQISVKYSTAPASGGVFLVALYGKHA